MKLKRLMVMFLVLGACALVAKTALADQFKIAIMQDERGAAAKFRPLENYLKSKGIEFSFVGATNYPAAANMFESGEVDAMFSGSGIAGTMILKDLAYPLVRPVSKEGHSTYHADIIAPAGSPKFTGQADYFRGKRVIFTPLASAGEFYFYSLPGAKETKATLLKAASHGAAIDALATGAADVAIVKNHVWNKDKVKYPKLVLVGEDDDENPDGTLIISKKANTRVVEKVSAALLALGEDQSDAARQVRERMNVKGYIKTTEKDFQHTLGLLKRAGISKSFNFEF